MKVNMKSPIQKIKEIFGRNLSLEDKSKLSIDDDIYYFYACSDIKNKNVLLDAVGDFYEDLYTGRAEISVDGLEISAKFFDLDCSFHVIDHGSEYKKSQIKRNYDEGSI